MVLKKDKKKVLGENFDDERIKTFLSVEAPDGINEDFHVLEKAYRSMIPENFATFVTFFKESGRDINAANPDGETVLNLVKTHRHGEEYLQPLLDGGAK